ncbi:MAG TPA: hypothetical protein VG651_20910 [Stellaceae bacterium]|nr:hypothetical protein [Stellaceae bacterium]
MLSDPQIVRVATSDARFDDTMERIRAWLDVENIAVAEFKVSPGDGGFEFELGFRSLADAERFRRRFAAPAQAR